MRFARLRYAPKMCAKFPIFATNGVVLVSFSVTFFYYGVPLAYGVARFGVGEEKVRGKITILALAIVAIQKKFTIFTLDLSV